MLEDDMKFHNFPDGSSMKLVQLWEGEEEALAPLISRGFKIVTIVKGKATETPVFDDLAAAEAEFAARAGA